MDVDNERLATDDEHMDYEEDPGSGRDDDGDEMMEDDVGGNQDAMDAESIPNTTDAPIPFPVATNHTLLTETAPILSPTSNAPGSAGLVSQPLPVLTGSAPKTEMLPVIEKPTLLNPKRESGEDPLKCMESSMPSTPFQVQNAPTLFGGNPKPQLSPAHQPIPTIVEETNMLAGPSRPVAQTTDAARSPRPNNGDDGEGDGGDEEEYYEEGPDDPIDTQSLPPIILNLPALGARILFAPLPDDGQQQKLPVWLSGRQEELGEASLSDIWVAIRAEMVREGLAKVGEMVVTERQMDLKMGEVSHIPQMPHLCSYHGPG